VKRAPDDVSGSWFLPEGASLAWIWPGQSGSDGMTETPDGNYENRYFDTEDEASTWLAAKG
jgi:hypothetical protein